MESADGLALPAAAIIRRTSGAQQIKSSEPLRLSGGRLVAETDFLIVLFTDFGLEGPYTGQVKAVLYQAAPGVPVIDLLSDAPAGRPRPAAYLLAAYGAWFSPGTVLLAVIDPGVGSARTPVIVEAEGRWYVGPDNGLFELVTRRAVTFRTWEIVWRPEALSASFHGRDLFGPVAGRLARGEQPCEIARPAEIGRHDDWPDDLPRSFTSTDTETPSPRCALPACLRTHALA